MTGLANYTTFAALKNHLNPTQTFHRQPSALIEKEKFYQHIVEIPMLSGPIKNRLRTT